MQRGNIYKGTVVTAETVFQAASDYGEGRNGFICYSTTSTLAIQCEE